MFGLQDDDGAFLAIKPLCDVMDVCWRVALGHIKRDIRQRLVTKNYWVGYDLSPYVSLHVTEVIQWIESLDPTEYPHPEGSHKGIVHFQRIINAMALEMFGETFVASAGVTAEDAYTPEDIEFMGEQFLGVKVDGQLYVAMKPIIEGMGLNWDSQHTEIRSTQKYSDIEVPLQTPDGFQKMLCIPLTKLSGWLFSINPETVRSDLHDWVITYQNECASVLCNNWNKGVATNPQDREAMEQEAFIKAML